MSSPIASLCLRLHYHFFLCIAIFVLLCAMQGKAQVEAGTSRVRLRVGEGVARSMASHRVAPKYPEESKTANVTGVAIAELVTNLDGTVESVEVLDSPDNAIAQAVVTALQQWRLPPLKVNGKPHPVVFKLTYYFRLRSSGFFVESPRSLNAQTPRTTSKGTF